MTSNPPSRPLSETAGSEGPELHPRDSDALTDALARNDRLWADLTDAGLEVTRLIGQLNDARAEVERWRAIFFRREEIPRCVCGAVGDSVSPRGTVVHRNCGWTP